MLTQAILVTQVVLHSNTKVTQVLTLALRQVLAMHRRDTHILTSVA